MTDKPKDAQDIAAELIARGGQVMQIQAPLFSCSGFRLYTTPNECMLQLHRQRPVVVMNGAEQVEGFQGEAVALVSMSPQTLKDLAILASDQIEIYEKEWGPVETEFTRSRSKVEK